MGSKPVGLSASRGSAVLGVNKYKTPLQAWLEIMEIMKPGFCEANGFKTPVRMEEWGTPLNPKMASIRFGHAFEGAICDLVGGITNREDFNTHPEYDFITSHIDGMKNGRNQENKTSFEMAFKMGFGEPGSAMIQESYQVQVQHQQMTNGVKMTDVNVLVFPRVPKEWEAMGYRVDMIGGIYLNGVKVSTTYDWARNLADMGYFHIFHCPADERAQAAMLERYLEFWNENVLKETPPPVKGYDDVKWLIASPEGEIEASPRIKELWQETVDIDDEIDSMIKRKAEIKDIFAGFVDQEMKAKNIKPGAEKRKLNCFAGSRKIFSITKAFPGVRVSQSTVDTMVENAPDLYEKMKKTSFLDVLGDIELTEKQAEKVEKLDEELEKIILQLSADRQKALKSLKLTKLLSRKNIMKQIEKSLPELHQEFFERGILYETDPSSSLRISKPEKD